MKDIYCTVRFDMTVKKNYKVSGNFSETELARKMWEKPKKEYGKDISNIKISIDKIEERDDL